MRNSGLFKGALTLSALLEGSEELASGQRANVAVEVAGEGDSQSNNHSRQAVQ